MNRNFLFFLPFAISPLPPPPSRNFPSLQNFSRGRPKEEKKSKKPRFTFTSHSPSHVVVVPNDNEFRGGNRKAGPFSPGGGGKSFSTSQKDHINYNAVDVCVGWKFHLVKCDENRIGINM